MLKRLTPLAWVLLGADGIVILALLFLAGRSAPNGAAIPRGGSDAAETELEGAKLALGEGDLAGVAERLSRLPGVSQGAMDGWMLARRPVVEARAALALLRAG